MNPPQTPHHDRCTSCNGRGWKLRTSRRDLLVRRAGTSNAGAAVVDCTNCAGSGLAEAA